MRGWQPRPVGIDWKGAAAVRHASRRRVLARIAQVAILAATDAAAPSLIQIRAQDITPEHASGVLFAALARFASQLEEGVLISVDEQRARARVLPLKRP